MFLGQQKRNSIKAELSGMSALLAAVHRSQAVIEFDMDGTIRDANSNFLSTVGYTSQEIIGQQHRMFVTPEYAGSNDYEQFWKDLRAGRFVAGKFMRVGRGGREIWLQATYNPVLDAQNRPVKVVKFAVDITDSEKECARNRAEKEAMERAQAESARAQSEIVGALAKGLARLKAGDLEQSLPDAFAPEYRQLRADYNSATDTLREALAQVVVKAGAIRSVTAEMSYAADQFSKRTEQQAASLEETTAALNEVNSTVRRTAEGALQASQAVGEAKSGAERSGQVVRDAVRAMSGIEESSRQISQIIGVIDEIAFQTNLLALNAGVEAARAGEAGRGFAVVASEVRALAQRSAEAAKEIKTLISASAQRVSSGVDLVGQAGSALERIVTQVSEINGIVAGISGSAQDQAQGLNEIATAITQMDQATQHNAAMVEESTAASRGLTQETEELTRLVAHFKTGSHVPSAARGPAVRRAASPALKVVGAGRAAHAASAQESWAEF